MESLYAIFLWKNDEPVTGNVLNINNIVEPRKSVDAYKEGDVVKAKCKGFGVQEAIIGKISDIAGKRSLDRMLNAKEFSLLVAKHIRRQSPVASQSSSSKRPGRKKQQLSSNEELDQIQPDEDTAVDTSSTLNSLWTTPKTSIPSRRDSDNEEIVHTRCRNCIQQHRVVQRLEAELETVRTELSSRTSSQAETELSPKPRAGVVPDELARDAGNAILNHGELL